MLACDGVVSGFQPVAVMLETVRLTEIFAAVRTVFHSKGMALLAERAPY